MYSVAVASSSTRKERTNCSRDSCFSVLPFMTDRHRVEEDLGRQHLDGHVAEGGVVGLVARHGPAGALVGLAGRDAPRQVLEVEARGGELLRQAVQQLRVRRRVVSSKPSSGLTKPRPKKCAHIRLTAARAKYGLSAAVAQAAKRGRNGSFSSSAARRRRGSGP